MTKISYPLTMEFLSFTCADMEVVMTTSISANRKLPTQHRLCFHFFFIHKSVALKNEMEFTNELPININIFDDEQSDRVDALAREISS